MRTCNKAFDNGWTTVKLYFMMGLPTETMEDIEGIADLGMKVVEAFATNPNKQKGTSVQVSISCSSFIPKPFTPFQWEPEDSMESLRAKQKHLLESIPTKKSRFHITKHRPRSLREFLQEATEDCLPFFMTHLKTAVNSIRGTSSSNLMFGWRLSGKTA